MASQIANLSEQSVFEKLPSIIKRRYVIGPVQLLLKLKLVLALLGYAQVLKPRSLVPGQDA